MTITTYITDHGAYRAVSGLQEARSILGQNECSLWIDCTDQGEEIQGFLRESLGLHPLAIEDVFEDRVTPKVEDYGDYLYLVMHGVHREKQSPESLGTIEIDVIIGKDWVFTHHTEPMRSIEELVSDLNRNPRLLQRGPAYIAHSIIDRLTDHYLPVVERFEEDLDDIEKQVIANPSSDLLATLFSMKRSLQKLRRISAYQRDILFRLSRGEFEQLPEKVLPFYRDVYDHFVRIADLTDSYREFVTTAVEIYMSVTANRTNEIMKVLALISTLMLPLTFIAGLYGMNFEYMPELKWHLGYPYALALMVIVVLLFLWFFRRKRWI